MPRRSASSASKRAPVWLTSPWPSVVTFSLGKRRLGGSQRLRFTSKVTLLVGVLLVLSQFSLTRRALWWMVAAHCPWE
ncbi:MAG: hypothetical protein ACYCXN_12270 [Acidimicrobiales bacterium]